VTAANPSPLKSPNTFANSPLDRAAHYRKVPAWLADKRKDPSSLVVPLWRSQPFLIEVGGPKGEMDVGWLRPGLVEEMAGPDAPAIFLGVLRKDDGSEQAHFALDISKARDPENSGPLAGLGVFSELRNVAMRLAPGEAAILAQAKSMLDWHYRHRFCANCGAPTRIEDAGYRRQCDACGAEHFPRTDPVVIMLPVAGDHCLLGRGTHFPEGMFSALAGFVEPGETMEEAVAREVMEEAGVRVTGVRYHSTQPWPYPSSLMIGCLCEAETEAITIDQEEIAEARWFSRDAVRAVMEGRDKGFWIPPPMAIAHQLIKSWVEEG